MKTGPTLFRITALLVVLQLLLGGLVTFGFVGSGVHVVLGLLVFIFAIATMVVAVVVKPSFRPLKFMSVALVVLVFIQGILGFVILKNGGAAVSWVHFANALLIYGIAGSSAFMSMRWERMLGEVSPGTPRPS